jgi:enoyl-CoA hydratase/carnithine racemase
MGLVNQVVPQAEVLSTAKEWAQAICKAAPLAVRAAKEAMLRGCDMTLEDGLRLENALVASVMATEDFTEGTTAFVEKRKPNYKAK